jgi:hypothetical protein
MPVITGVPANMNVALFQTEWTGGQFGPNPVAIGAVAFKYTIPVPNGNYTVRLHFAELNKTAAGQRTFDVNIEGTKRLDKFDIFAAAGGARKAIVREFAATIADGNVTIDFIRQVENAKVNAIEILPVTGPVNAAPVANAGSDQTLTAGAGNTASVTLNGAASTDPDGTIASYVWRSGNVQVATGATPTISLAAGVHVLTLTVTDNAGATATDGVTITVNSGVVCSLPTGWTSRDIGAVGRAGAACETSGEFTLNASGSDIWGTADQFHYAYQPLSCNGEIVARVNSLTNNDPWTKAGVMIRESLSANSRHAMMVVSATSGAAFQYRTNTGGTTTGTNRAATAPEWVKIVRSGNTFTGYISEDGINWGTPVGQATISMSSQAFIGLALTSHNNTQLATGRISNVSVASPGCTTSATAVRINAGGTGYTYPAPDGRVFTADNYFTASRTVTTSVDLPGRTDDVLYQTERSDASFEYRIPVTNGTYELTLHFAEVYWGVGTVAGGPGKRRFSVNVENQPALANFDIIAEAGGSLIALERKFTVNVTDGLLNISFFKGATGVDMPKVSALEVVPVSTARMNTAGTTGTASATGSLEVKVFPNPTDGIFRVDLSGVDAAKVTTRLADAAGNVWLRNKHLVIGEHMLELDITHLQPGVYLLEVQEGSRRRTVRVMKY